MTDRSKLTDRLVAGLRPSKTDQVYWDTEVRGFGVRFRTDRPTTWILQYSIGAQQRRKTLGQFPAMKATDARRMAAELRARVTLKEDVVLTERAKVAKADELKRGDKTFGVLIRDYLEQQKTKRRKNGRIGLSPRWQFQVEQHLTVAAKPLHKLPLADITLEHIADIVAAVHRTSGPTASNQVRGSLSAFFGWAIANGKATSNPVALSPKQERSSRDRVLSEPELRMVWRTLPDNHFGEIVRLLLLTAQRRGEIAGLRWSEIHDRQIVLPASRTKNGLTHIVPLSDQALQIIRAQPRRLGSNGKPRDLIFGAAADATFNGWSKSKTQLDDAITKAAGKPMPAWTLHDLRRSAATGMQRLGVRVEIIERALNHVSGSFKGIAGIYQRDPMTDDVRDALDKWAQRLQEIVNSKSVASLRGAA